LTLGCHIHNDTYLTLSLALSITLTPLTLTVTVSAMTHEGQYRATSCATRVARLKSLVCQAVARHFHCRATLFGSSALLYFSATYRRKAEC